MWLMIVWLFITEPENACPFIHYGLSTSMIGLRNFGELFSISYLLKLDSPGDNGNVCIVVVPAAAAAVIRWFGAEPE